MSTQATPTIKELRQCWQHILALLSGNSFYFREQDWDAFSYLIDWHHILLDILPELKKVPDKCEFSSEKIASLDNLSLAIKKRLLLQSHLQEQIWNHLHQSDIRALFFKGSVIAEWLYGSTLTRQSQDIDLIVHPRDFEKACNLLEQMSCKRLIPRQDSSESGLKRYRSAMKDFTYVHEKSGALIELHWRLRPFNAAFQFDFDLNWERHKKQAVDGSLIPTFDESTHIRYIAAHGCLSHWGRLRWLLDWHQISVLKPNWQQILGECANKREQAYIKNAFILAHEQLQTPIPEEIRTLKEVSGSGYCIQTQKQNQEIGVYPSWTKRQLLNLLNQQNSTGMLGYLGYMLKKGLAANTLKP